MKPSDLVAFAGLGLAIVVLALWALGELLAAIFCAVCACSGRPYSFHDDPIEQLVGHVLRLILAVFFLCGVASVTLWAAGQ